MTDKTVAQKAHIKPGTTVAVIGGVAGIVESLGLPGDTTFVGAAEAHLIYVFVESKAQLEERLPSAVTQLAPGSRLWVFYRKGSKAAGFDMSRDTIWTLAETLAMRPIGLLSVDDTWSAFMMRHA